MIRFITGNELNLELEILFENAKEQLILISPFIKLHDRYIEVLKQRLDDHKLKITIVFGKNEGDITRNLKDDFHFLKQFPNIEIRYEKRLHAKFYVNDNSLIMTSMNLYSYSQDNNIEFGILTSTSVLGNIAETILAQVKGEAFDKQAFYYFSRVIDQSELLFKKTPQYESGFLNLTKKYKSSIIEKDDLSKFIDFGVQLKAEYLVKTGYCIRTGKHIPFNIKEPMCEEALKIWKKYGNEDYREKYCHFSGEESFGETSMARPILRQNWDQAKFIHNF